MFGDLGYCLDPEGLNALERQTIRELIRRMQDLYQGLELDIASQYFELHEDLSRFSQTAALHTVPSILEGRAIFGEGSHLETLKQQILSVNTKEKNKNQ